MPLDGDRCRAPLGFAAAKEVIIHRSR
jgi:hypothetical protein